MGVKMEISLEQEVKQYSNMYKGRRVLEKMMQYFEDCNPLEMTKEEFQHIVDVQLAKVIDEGRLDEVYNKIINV